MISALLRKNISIWQLAAYTIACLTGLSILLISITFFADIRSMHEASGRTSDYITLSKPVTLLAALGHGKSDSNSFTGEEIDSLASQPWVARVGEFTSADFNISASVEFAGRGLSTALFFESLPDEFIDVDPDLWSFGSSSTEIPIMVPRDYLALYNFGFAASRGMPRLSEDLIKQIPLRIAMSGNGNFDIMPARIVGLSSRINTIAVPDSFMRAANDRYGDSRNDRRPTRLIVELSSPGDPAIARWIADNNLESSSGKSTSGQTVYIAGIASAVIGSIGMVIAVLSVLILLMSIFLLVQKSSDKIRNLTLLGYRRSQVASFYYRLIVVINGVVTVAATVICLGVSQLWTGALGDLGANGVSCAYAIIPAIVIMGSVTAVSIASCRKIINKTAR